MLAEIETFLFASETVDGDVSADLVWRREPLDLLGEPMKPLQIPWYATVLDLGPASAVYAEGWDRHVVAYGEEAKNTKHHQHPAYLSSVESRPGRIASRCRGRSRRRPSHG